MITVIGSGLAMLSAFAHLALTVAGAPVERRPISADAPDRERGEATSMSTIEAEVLRFLKGEEFQGLTELARLPSNQVVPVLLERATEDSDPLMRQRSVIALGAIGDPTAVPALQSRLEDPSAAVTMSAIDALVLLDHTPSAPRIAGLLASEDASVRQKAAQALGILGDPESEPTLRELLEHEPEPFVRDAVVRSLGHIKSRTLPTR